MFHYEVMILGPDNSSLTQFLEIDDSDPKRVLFDLITLYIDEYGEEPEWGMAVKRVDKDVYCIGQITIQSTILCKNC